MQRVLICWIIAAICLKAVVTGWSFRSVLRNRLASPLVVGKTVGLWLIIVAVLWASIRYWLHAGLFASVALPPLMRAAWFWYRPHRHPLRADCPSFAGAPYALWIGTAELS